MGKQAKIYGLTALALLFIGPVLFLSEHGVSAAAAPSGAAPVEARAELRDREGRSVGVANLTGTERGVRIEVQAAGLTPGRHGFHIHETGRCEPPDFGSAGGHFNPGAMHHGMENPMGPHGGDLPNVVAGADGRATLTTLNPYLSLGTGATDDLLRAGGTAVMIHAGPDDYYTDPAGDSGARVVCGVIERAH
jgi:Cu-Zn family superoxide dismutase